MNTSLKIYKDNRGSIKFINNNITFVIKQEFLSINHKNVIRGIHCSPYGKYITCLNGKIIDYVINFNEPITYEKYILDNSNCRLYIPPNHGHLFISLEDNTQILYQLEGKFDPLLDKNFNYKDPYINLDIKNDIHYILSDKDLKTPFLHPIDYIVLGGNGFIGSNICNILKKKNKHFIKLDTRLENSILLEKQLKLYNPKYVISAAGISGKPTIKWCETHKKETLHTNVTLQLNLSSLCDKLNMHLTICGSTLIYNGNKEYTENDKPNFDKYFYSKMRILLEEGIKVYDNVFFPRMIYPISSCSNKKSFLYKLTKMYYKNVDNKQINVTVLDSLIPCMIELIEKKFTGILNFVNPKSISLNRILELYRNNYDKNFTWKCSEIKNNQLNCIVNTDKLKELCPEIKNVEDAILDVILKLK